MIPRCVRGTAWRGFVFDLGACRCQSIKCPSRGSRYGGGEPVRASSKAEPHPRGRPALEWGGASPEGVSSPRARRNFTRGASSPRARRSFVSAVMCPSSEAEFRSRVAGAARAARSVGPYRWVVVVSGVSYSCKFACVLFFTKESGFSRLFRGPLWLSPTPGSFSIWRYSLWKR
jgi:hypothetical protein